MLMSRTLRHGIVFFMFFFLGGCAVFEQSKDMVLIREPGQRHYGPPVAVAGSAEKLWQYAVLSSNAYFNDWGKGDGGRSASPTGSDAGTYGSDAYIKACSTDPARLLPLEGWVLWRDFPGKPLRDEAIKQGLYVDVWESASGPKTVAVVFRGTEFESLADWKSNLRWFLRFVPGYKDQYIVLSKQLGQEFADELARRMQSLPQGDRNKFLLVAAGHSLGGGLAQYFAYSLPKTAATGEKIPRIAHVYAFDPSPVTGWYSVDPELRSYNAEKLEIDRVFEHGEILAYLRLFLSYAYPPSASVPAIREIRYNFVRSANVVASHSMARLACDLAAAKSKQTISGEKKW